VSGLEQRSLEATIPVRQNALNCYVYNVYLPVLFFVLLSMYAESAPFNDDA
jgi:hypothetical protein